MSIGRNISSITNESFPFDHCLQHNNNDNDSDDTKSNEDIGDNEIIIIDNIAIYNDDNTETIIYKRRCGRCNKRTK